LFLTIVSTEINAPLEKVYSYVRNLENMPNYNSSLKSAHYSNPNSCKIVLSLSIINIESEYIISNEETNKTFTASCKTSSLEFEDIYFFEKRGDKTFLEIRDSIQLKGILSWSEGILKNIFSKEMQDNLNRLVKILESN
jgi:uncharacterized membrane protein